MMGKLAAYLLLGAVLFAPVWQTQAQATTFNAPKLNDAGGQMPIDLDLTDLNQDGITDAVLTLAASRPTKSRLSLLLGNVRGSLNKDASLKIPYAHSTTVADFNNDGIADLAVVLQKSPTWPNPALPTDQYCGNATGTVIMLGDSAGNFTFTACVPAQVQVDVADFNGDGIADLAAASGTIHLGAGNGGFGAGQSFGGGGDGIVSADFDGDGLVDVSAGGDIFLGDGTGNFGAAIATGAYGMRPFAVDVNHDGSLDLIALGEFLPSRWVLNIALSNGAGGYNLAARNRLPADGGLSATHHALAVADLDQDGHPEIVTTIPNLNEVWVYPGNATGIPGAPIGFAVGTQPSQIAIGDYDQDGWQDLAVPDSNFGQDSMVWIMTQIPGQNTDTTPPTITLTAPLGGTVSGNLALSANAADNVGVSQVSFAVDGATVGASAGNGTNFSVNWNTNRVADGNHVIGATAQDAAGNQTSTAPVTVSVLNSLTQFTSAIAPLTEVNLGSSFIYAASASGGGPITFTLNPAPVGMGIAANGQVSWTPTSSDLGILNNVTLHATDGITRASQSFQLRAVDVTSPGAPTNLSVSAAGIDSLSLTWSAASDNGTVVAYRVYKYVTLNRFRKKFVLQATTTGTSYHEIGLKSGVGYKYQVQAVDAAGLFSISATLTATTLAAPTLGAPIGGVPLATEGALLHIALRLSGSPAPTLSLDTLAPVGMTVSQVGNNASIDWLPQPGDAGIHPVTVSASNRAGTASRSFSVTVKAAVVVNNPPVVSAQKADALLVLPNNTTTVSAIALDDGIPGALTYQWRQVSHTNLAGVPGTGTSSFANASAANTRVSFDQPGRYQVMVTVSDGALSTSATLNVAVVVNQAPKVTAGAARTSIVWTGAAGTTVSASATDDGLPAGALSYAWTASAGASISAPAAANSGVSFGAPGIYTLTVTASDGALSSTASVQVNVTTQDSLKPTAAMVSPAKESTVSGIVPITVNATDNVGVQRVEIMLNETTLFATLTTAPFTIDWDTTQWKNGVVKVEGIVWDAAGNKKTVGGEINVLN